LNLYLDREELGRCAGVRFGLSDRRKVFGQSTKCKAFSVYEAVLRGVGEISNRPRNREESFQTTILSWNFIMTKIFSTSDWRSCLNAADRGGAVHETPRVKWLEEVLDASPWGTRRHAWKDEAASGAWS